MRKSLNFLLFSFFFCESTLVFAQATLPTSWNFSTPGIANPPTGWITGLGTNGNLTYSGNGFSVGGDGISCRLDADGEFLQITFGEKPGALSYYIRGTGFGANPPFTGSFRVQESVDGTTWTDVRNFTSMTTTLTRYSESLASASRHVRFFYDDKQPNSNVALDSVMILQAPPSTVNMIVRNQTTTLVNNGVFIAGNASRTLFTIQNTGTATSLRVDSMILSGQHATDFSIGAFDSITPFGGGTDTFSVVFNPSAQGSRFATLSLYTNDIEKNPFTINIYAIGGLFASEPTDAPANFSISQVKPYGMEISFAHPTVKPERYIVLRKTGGTLTESPQDGISYHKGDWIGGAQVVYIGTDPAVIKPTFIFASTAYTFKAFSFNGPTGFENYLTSTAPIATTTTSGKQIGTYYAGINSTSANFVSSLSSRISAHDTVFYSQYISRFVSPFITRDTTGAQKVVNCAYTGLPYVYNEPFLWWTGNNSGLLTREHTYAQSWMPTRNQFGGWPNDNNGRELTEYNDLHNLYPTHQTAANAIRSNLPFGEVVGTPTYTSPSGLGKKGLNAAGVEVWEPADAHKGDVARALFYMCVAYNGIRSNTWTLPSNQDEAILKKWHFQDLPDAWEIARHEFIASLQNNRNPFVDSVNFACRINFSNMTWIVNPPVDCGIIEPFISILQPTNTSVWDAKSAGDSIAWNSVGVDSIDIHLFVNDTPYQFLKRVDASIGLYETEISSLDWPVTENAKIKLTATNANIAAFSSPFTISLFGNVFTHESVNTISVYPNPTSGRLMLINLKHQIIERVSIMNVSGQTILETNEPSSVFEIREPGIYLMRIQTPLGVHVKRIVVL